MAFGSVELGTGNVGDFSNLEGASIKEIFSRIPADAVDVGFKPEPGRIEAGYKFRWTDASGIKYEIHGHSADANAPTGSNGANGWTVRIQKSGGGIGGKWWLSKDGTTWYKDNVGNERSPAYNSSAWNDTHIPTQDLDDDDFNGGGSGGGGSKGKFEPNTFLEETLNKIVPMKEWWQRPRGEVISVSNWYEYGTRVSFLEKNGTISNYMMRGKMFKPMGNENGVYIMPVNPSGLPSIVPYPSVSPALVY
ncbi:polymorphic toxin type 30 domain-containing protein [Clostridium omnivorum]|uniref:Bacterial toxin 30 domain-containing protein n=1 Tax=Clostridium omnivorum TaxID=1604902 RepID=A0ABQ5N6V1_9CLOT|nr:polymorphic toxin type 30 domain-containing protein [Clostridium sp. E14]GLC30972.1 hypothetical protein bsdE14_23820 [Clostridium sp. E14]